MNRVDEILAEIKNSKHAQEYLRHELIMGAMILAELIELRKLLTGVEIYSAKEAEKAESNVASPV